MGLVLRHGSDDACLTQSRGHACPVCWIDAGNGHSVSDTEAISQTAQFLLIGAAPEHANMRVREIPEHVRQGLDDVVVTLIALKPSGRDDPAWDNCGSRWWRRQSSAVANDDHGLRAEVRLRGYQLGFEPANRYQRCGVPQEATDRPPLQRPQHIPMTQ